MKEKLILMVNRTFKFLYSTGLIAPAIYLFFVGFKFYGGYIIGWSIMIGISVITSIQWVINIRTKRNSGTLLEVVLKYTEKVVVKINEFFKDFKIVK